MNGPDDNLGKPHVSRLPDVLEEGAAVIDIGVDKHGEDNWRTEYYPISHFIDAGLRHVFAHNRGEDTDPESGQPHLVHAFVNFMMARELHREGTGVDDRREIEPVPPKVKIIFDEFHTWRPPRWWQVGKRRRLRRLDREFKKTIAEGGKAHFIHGTTAGMSDEELGYGGDQS